MHRRRFLTVLATLAVAPRLTIARQFDVEETPAPDQAAPVWDAVRYEHPDYDAAIRTIEVRVSIWDDPTIAGTVAGSLTANAGTALPEGEFYHSEVVDWTPQIDASEVDEITGREWNTVVGVAAFTTYWAQIVVWYGRKLTVVLVSGDAADGVRGEAERLATLALNRIPMPCGPELDPLPAIDEVPSGMILVWRADETGPQTADEPAHGASFLAECTQVDDPA